MKTAPLIITLLALSACKNYNGPLNHEIQAQLTGLSQEERQKCDTKYSAGTSNSFYYACISGIELAENTVAIASHELTLIDQSTDDSEKSETPPMQLTSVEKAILDGCTQKVEMLLNATDLFEECKTAASQLVKRITAAHLSVEAVQKWKF